MEGALQYLRIYFLGSPAFLVYNFGAALLRTSGDTRRPMYFLTLAGVANAGMNLFFVLGLGWRTVQMAAAGVALATILSHYVSAICVLVCLFRSRNFLRLEVRRIRIHPRLFRRILVLGVPAGIQSSLFSISNIMLQSNINSFGAIAMAGNTAAVSLESFAGTAMDAFQQSSVTFIGQNKGAGRYDRFVGVWRTNLLTAMVSSLLLGMALYALSPALLQLYIASDASPDTLSFALSRCAVDFPLYLAAGMMVVGGGTLRGLGRSTTAMLSSVFGICGLRFFWMGLIYPRLIPLAQGNPFEQIKALYLVYPFTWFVTALLQMGLFFLFLHLQKKKHPELFLRPQERICRETEKETV